ncbi:MAG TPA: ATP-binding protein [Polyangiaceae bacterium]
MRKARVQRTTGVHAARTDRASQTVPSEAGPSDGRGEPVAVETPSAAHARVPDLVPAAWLDRLLVAAVELPLASGDRVVVEGVVDVLAAILPDHAVGACFAPEPGTGRRDRLVVKRLPAGIADVPGTMHPTRIFSWLAHEHVAAVVESTTGSTLHVASDDDPVTRDGSPALHIVDRAAVVLGRSLQHARKLAEVAGATRDTRALEERMIQADKLATFGQIAAGVVHELNNPLTSIVAYSDYLIRQALARGAQDPDDVERLRRISESANRMLRFTRDLVHYARPSGGQSGPVVLHGVVDQALAFCEHVLAAASVRVERRFGADVLAVRGISEQLVQVFVNLFTNASQAAPSEDGCVVVTTSLDAGERRVRVLVEDNGTGIAPEHVDQVFLPFFTTKGDRHGTGLGLSIVRSIVESHEGEIRVESEAGRGTRFVIDLPAWQRPG